MLSWATDQVTVSIKTKQKSCPVWYWLKNHKKILGILQGCRGWGLLCLMRCVLSLSGLISNRKITQWDDGNAPLHINDPLATPFPLSPCVHLLVRQYYIVELWIWEQDTYNRFSWRMMLRFGKGWGKSCIYLLSWQSAEW